MIELAMPAGSIQSGLVAFRDGADAIYLGLQSFSARKNATNFSIEEYSKIYAFAKENNKRVYITINTVIYDAQLPSIIRLLKKIELIGSDGLIIQDLGVAKIINNFFPTLELHGSTQLAVHSVEGVKAMQKLGFTRVVLSRELTIDEISNIREKCKDVELKVFIHGALCYGFSGLCMASRIITKRSANAGACAQICRTWFTKDNDNGYFFSMKDLDSSDSVKKLKDINIDSLKVEGRMKSPSYVSAVTKYYRAILDNQPYEHLIEDVKTSFSRNSSKGWLDNYDNDKINLVDNYYPSHKGVFCSEVIEIKRIYNDYFALLNLETDLSLHDGLMFINENNEIPLDIKFSVKSLLNNRKQEIKRAKKNQRVYLLLTNREDNLNVGDSLYLIKKHDQDEKKINIDRMPISKNYAKAQFFIYDDLIKIRAIFPFINEVDCKKEYKVQISHKKSEYKTKIENIFKQSQKSNFEVDEIEIINNSTFDTESIFLPLSEIKKLRRAFYEEIDLLCEDYINKEIEIDKIIHPLNNTIDLPNKSLLTKYELPFFQEVPTLVEDLIIIDDKYYLPLPPVFFNEYEQINNLSVLYNNIKERHLENSFFIGLNNIAHINWIKDKDIKVYADIYFYLANRFSAQTLLDLELNLVGGYLFLETVVGDISKWPFIPTRIEKDFIPPLFISRTNFNFDSLGETKKNCRYNITQRDQEYTVISNNELTYLIKRN
ncbi:MAG: DUF3656 domain-containing U32 family peptidase [Pleomorphochaeta sp.]